MRSGTHASTIDGAQAPAGRRGDTTDRGREPMAEPKDVATFLVVSTKTLEKWRGQGTGPRFTKVGAYVRYRWKDVDDWLKQNQGGGAPLAG